MHQMHIMSTDCTRVSKSWMLTALPAESKHANPRVFRDTPPSSTPYVHAHIHALRAARLKRTRGGMGGVGGLCVRVLPHVRACDARWLQVFPNCGHIAHEYGFGGCEKKNQNHAHERYDHSSGTPADHQVPALHAGRTRDTVARSSDREQCAAA